VESAYFFLLTIVSCLAADLVRRTQFLCRPTARCCRPLLDQSSSLFFRMGLVPRYGTLPGGFQWSAAWTHNQVCKSPYFFIAYSRRLRYRSRTWMSGCLIWFFPVCRAPLSNTTGVSSIACRTESAMCRAIMVEYSPMGGEIAICRFGNSLAQRQLTCPSQPQLLHLR